MHKRSVACSLSICIAFLLITLPVTAEDSSDWYIKAQNAATLGNYVTAVQYYENAISLSPNYASAYAGKALALNQLKRYDDAIASADKALLIKKDPDALSARAYALFSLGRDQEAVLAYDALFTLQQNAAEGYCNQGKAYIRLNDTQKALASFNSCVRYAPKSLDGWNQKGLALLSLGRYKEALDAFNHCTQISTKNAEVWNNKGLAYAGLENYTDALDCFKMAINLNPSFTEAKTNLDKAYLRKPFVTPSATNVPAGTATTIPVQTAMTSVTYTTVKTPGTPAATLLPTSVPQESSPEARTTYASSSALIAIGALVSGSLLAYGIHRRPR